MQKKFCSILFFSIVFLTRTFVFGQQDALEDTLRTVSDKDKIRIMNEWIGSHPFENEQNIDYSNRIIRLARKTEDRESEVTALKNIGTAHKNMNNREEALNYYLQGFELAEEIDFKDGMSNCIYNMGIIFRESSELDQALEYFKRSLEIDSLSGNMKNIAYSLNLIGVVYAQMGNDSEALEYYSRSLSMNREINDTAGIANSLYNIGDIYRSRGDHTRAFDNYTRALLLFESINDRLNIAKANNALGYVFEGREEYGNAAEHYLNALQICEEISDIRGIAESQNNIGVVYKMQHDYEMALDYFRLSYVNYFRIQDQEGIAISYTNIGQIHELTGNYSNAIQFYQSALEIEEKLGNRQGISLALSRIGNIYDKGLNNYRGALEYYLESLDIKKETGDTLGMTNILKTIGYVHQKYGNFEEALKYLDQSLELAEKIKSNNLLKTIHSIFSEFYAAKGDYKNALESFKLSSFYRDSVFNEENQQIIAQWQTRYDTEKKEKENMILRQENEIQTLQISRQRNIRNSLIAISLLVLVLVIVVYGRYRSKKKANELLNQKNQLLEEQKNQIGKQKVEIEIKNKHITDSINYAKGIQDAMLPRIEQIKESLPELFIYFRPRDIVSGDFYWFSEVNGRIIIAAVDCTGHGVPGGFVSMMGNDLLNEIVDARGITESDKILNELHRGISNALKQKENQNRDGMDMALCVIDRKKNIIEYSGAKNPLIFISKGKVHRIRADKMPIGGIEDEELQEKIFTKHEIDLDPPKIFYMFSDGYPDQFGGKEKKKFMSKPFRDLLFEIHENPMDRQKDILDKTFVDWMGDESQVDDVLVVGFKS